MIQKGDIILSRTNSYFGRTVFAVMNFFQRDPVYFNHSLIAINSETGIESDLKIQKINISRELEKYKNYKIIRYKKLSKKQAQSICHKVECLQGLPYSFLRAFFQLFDHIFYTNYFTRNYNNRQCHVCSSLIAWVYYVVCGINFNNVEWKSCDPDDIEDHQIINSDWECVGEK